MLFMMNDLLKIQNEMGLPQGQSRPARADRELDYDEVVDDQSEWLGISTNYSPYHTGYTTSHWLMVFRPLRRLPDRLQFISPLFYQ